MDQSVLVSGGQALVAALDEADMKPRAALWVHNTDVDTWKLWIVPPAGMTDKRQFYRNVAKIVSTHQNVLSGIGASDTEMVLDTHPAIKGLKGFINAPGLSSIIFTGNKFNDFYLPDSVLLRVDL